MVEALEKSKSFMQNVRPPAKLKSSTSGLSSLRKITLRITTGVKGSGAIEEPEGYLSLLANLKQPFPHYQHLSHLKSLT